jgi:hypothetical protein
MEWRAHPLSFWIPFGSFSRAADTTPLITGQRQPWRPSCLALTTRPAQRKGEIQAGGSFGPTVALVHSQCEFYDGFMILISLLYHILK